MKTLSGLALYFATYQLLETNVLPPTMEDFEECFLPVVLQYQPQNVHLICEESSYCPSHIINRIPGIAWTFYDREETVILAHEWEDVCVLAADDVARISTLLKLYVKCHKTKSILTFPADISSADMKRIFDVAWSVGIVDVVLSKRVGYFCECHTYYRGKINLPPPATVNTRVCFGCLSSMERSLMDRSGIWDQR